MSRRAQEYLAAQFQLVEELERMRELNRQLCLDIIAERRIKEKEIEKLTSQRNFWKDAAEQAAYLLTRQPLYPDHDEWLGELDKWLEHTRLEK